MKIFIKHINKSIALALTLLLLVGTASAGLTITRSSGVAVTGADGINFINTSGVAVTGADGLLTFSPNGVAVTGADGVAVTGADGVIHAGTNGVAVTGADSLIMNFADGVAVTGADGVAVTGADGQTFYADSVAMRRVNGVAVTGADGLDIIGVDGVATTGADSLTIERADGVAVTGADSFNVPAADSVTVTGLDGRVFSIAPNGVAVTGADTILMTYTNGVAVTGADGVAVTGADGVAVTGADDGQNTGLQSVDPEFALLLDKLSDDSNINAMIVYHQLPTEADINELQRIGVIGGTRYRVLPVIAVTATKEQIISISRLPAVRSIYGNRTLQSNADSYLALNCAERIAADNDLTQRNQGLPVSGRNVQIAVLDTGIDATHPDLAGRVVQNVKLLDSQSISAGFTNPVFIENLLNTDQLYGHGTFVAGVIAGTGNRSNGRYAGLAPNAQIVGLSAGDLTLSFVLSGFDYLLAHSDSLNVRVLNCSFSANTVFDFNDPVNIATKMLTERGINVVFSAGNTGPGLHTLNPYAVAPWVISVGATDYRGRLASFSSRGAFASAMFRPTIVAPGVNLIGPRAVGITGAIGLVDSDTQRLRPSELPYYTTASGTSFSAPQVAATIAMMLEVNPGLTPSKVRDIIQRTATPLAHYYQHEVGAGLLNAHAAVLEAAFSEQRIGAWRSAVDRGYAQFINDPPQVVSGSVSPGSAFETTIAIPQNALVTSAKISWGPVWSTNDLGLTLIDDASSQQTTSNNLNLPGLTGKRESVLLNLPANGTRRLRITSSPLLSTSRQDFTGVIETTRVQFSPVSDISNLSATEQGEIYQTIRTRVMAPSGTKFRPGFGLTRVALAAAMVYAGRVPQYLAATPRYTDVKDITNRNFVESAQFSPSTALFLQDGSNYFRPNELVDRLTAVVVLVRAAGLRAEAESQPALPMPLIDALTIPAQLRGYVSIALSRGLIKTYGNAFGARNALTRAELAHALVVLQQMAKE
jgi:serine protease AprX